MTVVTEYLPTLWTLNGHMYYAQKIHTKSHVEFKTLQPCTELRITAGQQTISDQLCCMSDHDNFSEISNHN